MDVDIQSSLLTLDKTCKLIVLGRHPRLRHNGIHCVYEWYR